MCWGRGSGQGLVSTHQGAWDPARLHVGPSHLPWKQCRGKRLNFDTEKPWEKVIPKWKGLFSNCAMLTSWWFQPNWNILVKLDHFPKYRHETKKSFKPPPSQLCLGKAFWFAKQLITKCGDTTRYQVQCKNLNLYSWWLNQPSWKNISQNGSSPQVGLQTSNIESKKSPTGHTEQTRKAETLIALATYLGVRW